MADSAPLRREGSAEPEARPRAARRHWLRAAGRRLRVGQVFALACGLLVAVAVAGTVLGVLSLHEESQARNLVIARIDPARDTALRLGNALINQESAVRGFVITGRSGLLDPYHAGREQEQAAYTHLERLTRGGHLASVRADVARVREAASLWHSQYARPLIELKRNEPSAPLQSFRAAAGRELYSEVRAALSKLQVGLGRAAATGRARFENASRRTQIVFGAFAAVLLCVAILLIVALRTFVSHPIEVLTSQVRRVARGAFQSAVEVGGPRDVAELAADVDSMRLRIVHELEMVSQANNRLDTQAQDLARSNSELEQFAYVASHDLQEPLRKVASFTQLLQRRYQGRLDERADEYIEFAVDGAKRMQTLINDLLAFSRVGRIGEPQDLVDLGEALSMALRSLAHSVEETGAEIDASALPTVRGERGLLALVFQNLISNALKFRRSERPLVRIRAERQGEEWLISCADNGIGVEPQYRERIFVIFQRLHPRERYEGTGIGLAMCRKIVEYHGGRIWVQPDSGGGACFVFTLPVASQPDSAPAEQLVPTTIPAKPQPSPVAGERSP